MGISDKIEYLTRPWSINATEEHIAVQRFLIVDEIHHLSKLVREKLMKALRTDKNNKMSIRRIGSNNEKKVELKIIFATNKSIAELKNDLLPEFYDRIVQYVVNISPL
jgi:transcriptional regulator with AAA-type ATPase domain